MPPPPELPGSSSQLHNGRVNGVYVIAPCHASPSKSLAASFVDSPSRIVSGLTSSIVRRIARRTSALRSSSPSRPVMFATSMRQPSSENGGFR